MNPETEQDWLELCRQSNIDPEEVRLVFARYEAYRKYTNASRSATITIDQWFRFYHMEKASEGDQAQPAPSGCSVDSDAVNNACIKRPAEFLQVLRSYAGEQGSV
jgi:hypothetical protein